MSEENETNEEQIDKQETWYSEFKPFLIFYAALGVFLVLVKLGVVKSFREGFCEVEFVCNEYNWPNWLGYLIIFYVPYRLCSTFMENILKKPPHRYALHYQHLKLIALQMKQISSQIQVQMARHEIAEERREARREHKQAVNNAKYELVKLQLDGIALYLKYIAGLSLPSGEENSPSNTDNDSEET